MTVRLVIAPHVITPILQIIICVRVYSRARARARQPERSSAPPTKARGRRKVQPSNEFGLERNNNVAVYQACIISGARGKE